MLFMRKVLIDINIYTDLDELAGTWTEEEYHAFLKNFEQVDEEMWKT